MSEHTKGRLREVCNDLVGEDGKDVAKIAYISNANARRLVACWNACEGVSTESLESAIPGASILDTQFAESKLERGRAELMAVCEREAAMPCRCAAPHSQCISCAARAAIAKHAKATEAK